MRTLLVLLFLALLVWACAREPRSRREPELVGAWRSDEAKTHAEVRKFESRLTAGQKAIFFRPGFFGTTVQVIGRDRGMMIFEGECQPVSPCVLEIVGNDVVRLRRESGTSVELEVHGDEMSLPLATPSLLPGSDGAKEIFHRISLDEVEKLHPCFKAVANQFR